MKAYEINPVQNWNEAFPIGNGRLGAMVYGDPLHETVQLNEESVWSGWFDGDTDNPDCARLLPKIREAIFSGDYETSEALINENLICRGKGSSSGYEGHFGSYQTAGELHIDLELGDETPTDYSRSLDFETGLAEARFTVGGISIRERVFSSFADGVTVVHYKASSAISALCRLTRERADVTANAEAATLILSGSFPFNQPDDKGIAYATVAKISHEDGSVSERDGGLYLEGVTSFCIILNTRTTYEPPKGDGSPKISRDVRIPIEACMKSLAGFALVDESELEAARELFRRRIIAVSRRICRESGRTPTTRHGTVTITSTSICR